MSNHLVVGLGEVGRSVRNLMDRVAGPLSVMGADIGDYARVSGDEDAPERQAKYIHICFPYKGADFVDWGIRWSGIMSRPPIVLVHSTVAVGTTRKLGRYAVHTPTEGLHPNLELSMRTFRKHLGGPCAPIVASEIYDMLGVVSKCYVRPETTELSKLLSTASYGIEILKAREQERLCRELGLSFKEVVLDYSESYNAGYKDLDHERFVRPIIFPPQGEIGGHCVVPNAGLLPGLPGPLHMELVRQNLKKIS